MDGREHRRTEPELVAGEPGNSGDGAYSEDGVDLTLIRLILGLTCTERLQAAQGMADTVDKLRGARER